MSESYKEYYEITGGKPPHDETARAFELLLKTHDPTGSCALDFGCGAGRDSRFLLDQGLLVTAVDADPEGIANLNGTDRLTVVASTFDTFTFQEYDLITSRWALSFNSPATFNDMFSRLKASLKPDGILSCNIFGKNDEWAKNPRMTFLSEEEIRALLEGLQIRELKEKEYDGQQANGIPKHWHLFDILAQKT